MERRNLYPARKFIVICIKFGGFMKKNIPVTLFALLIFQPFYVSAACNGSAISDVSSVINGEKKINGKLTKVIQKNGTNIEVTDVWNEVHCSNGDLWEIAQGSNSTIDRSKKVGTWQVSNDTVTYTYYSTPSDLSYTYTLHDNSSNVQYPYCLQNNSNSAISIPVNISAGGVCN